MNKDIILKEEPFYLTTELGALAEQAKEYASHARSKNTNKSYGSDWRDFEGWCADKGLISLPAISETVSLYLTDRATNEWTKEIKTRGKPRTVIFQPLKISSLRRRLTSITQAHLAAGLSFDRSHPAIVEVWKGIQNKNGSAQTMKKPLLLDDIKEMLDSIPIEKEGRRHLLGYRDRALLLFGFVGAFRRSELVSLTFQDVDFTKEGIVVNLRRSKTDQAGKGRTVPIPFGSNPLTCPVRTLKDWLEASELIEGAIFRSINRHGQIQGQALSSHAVALIIKRNVPEEEQENFSGHSLRAGFVTTAAIAGVPEHIIMRQTGHKRSDTIKRYIRFGNMWQENAASKIGL